MEGGAPMLKALVPRASIFQKPSKAPIRRYSTVDQVKLMFRIYVVFRVSGKRDREEEMRSGRAGITYRGVDMGWQAKEDAHLGQSTALRGSRMA